MSKQFTQKAQKILKERYYLRNKVTGELLESSPEQLFTRVANFIAKAEKNYKNGDYKKWRGRFYEAMMNKELMPASPILFNAGTPKPMMSACFGLEVEDTMDSILQVLVDSARIFKSGGGMGFSFSKLRESGARLSTGGTSSGPIPFMSLYNQMIEAIKQGGKRRGAALFQLDATHKDIKQFIKMKQTEGIWSNANISVVCSDKFMNSVKRGFKKNTELWNQIIHSTWKSGDPGFLWSDTIEKFNPIPNKPMSVTNACSELIGPSGFSCNISGINLDKVLKGKKGDMRIDYDKLGKLIKIGHRFLDNTIDMSLYPTETIKNQASNSRLQGLYLFGLAPFLIKLGLRYGSQESLERVDNLFNYINTVSLDVMRELGHERGNFPDFGVSILKNKYKYMRASHRLCLAPSGTTSRIADSYFSIEPYFAFEYDSHIMDQVIKEEFNIKDEYKNIFPRALITAHELTPKEHVNMVATISKYIDLNISKTINMSNDSTVEDISDIIMYAYKKGLKSVTVFRDGCKSEQVLNKIKEPIECRSGKCEL